MSIPLPTLLTDPPRLADLRRPSRRREAAAERRDALTAAAVLGVTAGLRSMTPLAALALGGRFGERPFARLAPVVAAAGEWVADKHPRIPPRTAPPVLAGRLLTGALAGALVAGPPGAGLGAATAGASSFAAQHARSALGGATGLPDPLIATAEDLLAAGLAAAAVMWVLS